MRKQKIRIRRSLLKPYNLRKRKVGRDKEGGSIVDYEAAIPIEAAIWSASGKMQAEMYGERLNYIKNMQYEGAETMREGDGICVDVGPDDTPDYKIIVINNDFIPAQITLERI